MSKESFMDDDFSDFQINLDDDLELDLEPAEEEIVQEEPVADKLKKTEEDLPFTSKQPSDDAARFQREKEEIERQLDIERKQRFDAERIAAKNAIDNMEYKQRAIRSEITYLKGELEVAKQEGDTDKIKKIFSEIDKREEEKDLIVQDINKYKPLLDRNYEPPVGKKVSESTSDSDGQFPLADSWYKDNKHWFDDPAYLDKREKAIQLIKRYKEADYDLNSIKVWSRLDQELSESDKKRTPPVMRGEINQAGNSHKVKMSNELQNQKQMAEKLALKIMKDYGYTESTLMRDESAKRRFKEVARETMKEIKKHNIKSLRDINYDI